MWQIVKNKAYFVRIVLTSCWRIGIRKTWFVYQMRKKPDWMFY